MWYARRCVCDAEMAGGVVDAMMGNMMDEIMDLATSTVSRSSFQDDFRSIAASVGSTLESSRLSKLSAEAVRDAAVAAEDEVSGVNMDEEAAKLITQQQAYQAAARILQTAKEMFDTLMQIR